MQRRKRIPVGPIALTAAGTFAAGAAVSTGGLIVLAARRPAWVGGESITPKRRPVTIPERSLGRTEA